MDDKNNKGAVDNQVVNLSQPVGQTNQQAPTQLQQDQKPTPVAPSSPVGLAQKEQEPSSVADIQPSQPEIELHKEVEKAGVKVVSGEPRLTEKHKKLGIEHAGELTPFPTITAQQQMTEDEVKEELKHGDKTNSRHWLAVLIEKIYKILKS